MDDFDPERAIVRVQKMTKDEELAAEVDRLHVVTPRRRFRTQRPER